MGMRHRCLLAVAAPQGSRGLLCPAPGLRILPCSQGPTLWVVCASRQVSALPSPGLAPALASSSCGIPVWNFWSSALDLQPLTPACPDPHPPFWALVPCQALQPGHLAAEDPARVPGIGVSSHEARSGQRALSHRCGRRSECSRGRGPEPWLWSFQPGPGCLQVAALIPASISREERREVGGQSRARGLGSGVRCARHHVAWLRSPLSGPRPGQGMWEPPDGGMCTLGALSMSTGLLSTSWPLCSCSWLCPACHPCGLGSRIPATLGSTGVLPC